uniref:Uncharacterized protein n=1 Tax=Schistocephalus solidus TaxID=70667 RepID=A0A0X3NZ17_SCHSO
MEEINASAVVIVFDSEDIGEDVGDDEDEREGQIIHQLEGSLMALLAGTVEIIRETGKKIMFLRWRVLNICLDYYTYTHMESVGQPQVMGLRRQGTKMKENHVCVCVCLCVCVSNGGMRTDRTVLITERSDGVMPNATRQNSWLY